MAWLSWVQSQVRIPDILHFAQSPTVICRDRTFSDDKKHYLQFIITIPTDTTTITSIIIRLRIIGILHVILSLIIIPILKIIVCVYAF